MSTEPQITVSDLQNALKIIDLAAKRGAFAGEELSAIGSVRDRLATFVEAATSQTEEQPQTETVAESPVTEQAPTKSRKRKPAA